MIEQFLKIQFHGFNPNFDERRSIFSVMHEIEYSAPSDASVKFEVTKRGDLYRGVCRVASRVGIFTADCEAENLDDLLRIVHLRIGGYLQDWKVKRFNNDQISAGEYSPAS